MDTATKKKPFHELEIECVECMFEDEHYTAVGLMLAMRGDDSDSVVYPSCERCMSYDYGTMSSVFLKLWPR